jgi:hypothetical protein
MRPHRLLGISAKGSTFDKLLVSEPESTWVSAATLFFLLNIFIWVATVVEVEDKEKKVCRNVGEGQLRGRVAVAGRIAAVNWGEERMEKRLRDRGVLMMKGPDNG